MTTNQETPPRIVSDEYDTRYIELSAHCDQDAYWHPSVTITLAAFNDQGVLLHRMKSEETAVRFDLSTEEIQALIAGYTAYVAACKSNGLRPNIDLFADRDKHPL
jgi:hypothetical protein